jgi:hypothetical protein
VSALLFRCCSFSYYYSHLALDEQGLSSMDTLFFPIIVAHYKSIGVSTVQGHISSYGEAQTIIKCQDQTGLSP